MFRPGSFLIGLVLGCLPVPDPPRQGGSRPAGRMALYWKYRSFLIEAALTAAACSLTRLLFRSGGQLTALWAGLGALSGRLSPLRKDPRETDGAAVVWACEIFFSPVWGILCCAVGTGVSFLTGYELFAALLPAALFTLPADLFSGPEAGLLALASAGLLVFHRRAAVTSLMEGGGREDTSDDGA